MFISMVRLALVTSVRCRPPAGPPVRFHSRPLGWDADRRALEIDTYLKRVQAELDSQRQPDDPAADHARAAAPDIVPAS
jgi:glycerol-3-phosphate dehydrogenase